MLLFTINSRFFLIYLHSKFFAFTVESTTQRFGRNRLDNHQLNCIVSEEPLVWQQSVSNACRTFGRNFSATVTHLSCFISKYQGKEPSKNVFIFKFIFYLNILSSWYCFMYIFAVEHQVSFLNLVSSAGHKPTTNFKPFLYRKQHPHLGQREGKTITLHWSAGGLHY